MMLESNEKSFEQDVLKAEGKTLVFFYRESGCQFCDIMKPVVSQYAEQNPEIRVVRYKLGNAPDSVNQKYPIERFPTFYAFENGVVVGKQEGAMPMEKLGLTFTPNLIPKQEQKQVPLAQATLLQLIQEEAAILDNLSKLKEHYLEIKREINKRRSAAKEWEHLAEACCDGCAEGKDKSCSGGCGSH